MIVFGKKIDGLLQAIAEHEGWSPPDEKTNYKGSRSYRNHNPGNLRSSPFQSSSYDNFAVFSSDFVGMFALYWDIFQKSRGQTSTGLNGQSTLKDLIYVWAPPSDNNDTEAYIRRVEQLSGLPASTTLSEVFKKS